MTLPSIQRAGHSAFHVSQGAFGQVVLGTSGNAGNGAAQRSLKWRLLAADELARPGFMTLRAVRDGGQIVDFAWTFASAAAARLLGHTFSDLLGHRLRDAFAGNLGHLAVLEQYRRVVEHGTAEAIKQVHVVNGLSDIYRHGAVRLGDGVAVTLTNLSAVRRAQALRIESHVQQAANEQRVRQPAASNTSVNR
jgi:PAS domain-containing protein